jgi:proteic killer suppression protein
MKNIFNVVLSSKAKKQLTKLPQHVAVKLISWVEAVNHEGILSVRKIPGYHDEPLLGTRLGQRSIRLSKSYRAIYIQLDNGQVQFIEIMEVHKHDY